MTSLTMTALSIGVDSADPQKWNGARQIGTTWEESVVTLGVFDGLHRGHVSLLEHAGSLGRQHGLPVVLTTFDPHPVVLTGQSRDIAQITPLGRKVELARHHGADEIVVITFDRVVSQMTGEEFATSVLVGTLGARHVVVGEGFRFGRHGSGDVAALIHLGARHGFEVHARSRVPGCSSTRVRKLVRRGAVERAASVLGRPHRLRGTVAAGRVKLADGLTPAPGSYVVAVGEDIGVAHLGGQWLTATWPIGDGVVDVDFLTRA
jgi:riboflavin kinase/FMN adenylyltransferase